MSTLGKFLEEFTVMGRSPPHNWKPHAHYEDIMEYARTNDVRTSRCDNDIFATSALLFFDDIAQDEYRRTALVYCNQHQFPPTLLYLESLDLVSLIREASNSLENALNHPQEYLGH